MDLRAKVDECFARGADVAKIAVAVVSRRGAARVLALYDDERPVVALGMGPHGVASRVAACPLGSPFTFVAWSEAEATAPGQLTRDACASVLSGMGFALGGDVQVQSEAQSQGHGDAAKRVKTDA